ncbi:hypothetical protein GCM10027514_19040 [Azotobacter armeniacus]
MAQEHGINAKLTTRFIKLFAAGMLLEHLPTVVSGSLLGKALQYLSGQWPKLIRYVENGAWPISNNLCESAIRPFVASAHASANLYSLVETCKANPLISSLQAPPYLPERRH